jgi:peptide/nickel transport system substrate-binding protein
VVRRNDLGLLTLLRFNFLNAPFNNPRLRRVLLSAVDQNEYMLANVGDLPNGYRTCYSMFACNLPNTKEMGADIMGGEKNIEALRKAVKDAGYNGEKVVILNSTNYHFTASAGQVTADLLKRLGMNVDLQDMDFGTMFRRRANRGPVDQGGWSIFHTGANAEGQGDPGSNFFIRGQGANGWAGWYDSPEMERLTSEWIGSATEQQAQDVLDQIQRLALNDVPIIPLGQYYAYNALRRELTGYLPCSYSLFWNLRRA